MSTKTRKKSNPTSSQPKPLSVLKNEQAQTIFTIFFACFSIILLIALTSHLLHWKEDQSTLYMLGDRKAIAQNALGKLGAYFGNLCVNNGFGIAALMIPIMLLRASYNKLRRISYKKNLKIINWGVLGMLWNATTFGFLFPNNSLIAGAIGIEMNLYLVPYVSYVGLIVILLFGYFVYFTIKLKINNEHIAQLLIRKEKPNTPSTTSKNDAETDVRSQKNQSEAISIEPDIEVVKPIQHPIQQPTQEKAEKAVELGFASNKPNKPVYKKPVEDELLDPDLIFEPIAAKEQEKPTSVFEMANKNIQPTIQNHSKLTLEPTKETLHHPKVEISVTAIEEEVTTETNLADQLVKDFGEFDPKLDLGNYKFPTLNILREHNESIAVNAAELEANKDKIVNTLNNYSIGISKIKATVGPTITLYEIVPDAGVRISKIKNLEDDIALSLAALGIRIIAPIPGKGTIGIEVPNQQANVVSMHSVIASKRFQESDMELPIALGKTISNETFVFDLAKTPHLLMAGATGQGKSVGLNAILTSLLYKKHPAEIKFVLVDPKKVELTLFNKIERHYLAKLPDTDDAIITDTTKVINTLNSLCIEMDNRYSLLKLAMVRNIKEYNLKFKARKLNPENGHKFLPYIVLVIDEFADLIMTAGKEVETPIARLAQLARAIGIHLIVATQRPSVNVITGLIKANFPARIAFRVTSKIDSRTILDAPGADQLIGRGDLLYSSGNDLTRVQCAFIDTPEVEKVTDYIGSQRAYPEAYQLPEYVGEESGTNIDFDINDRDDLFNDAAEIIVTAQQGSASLLQRKLKLGYNRAGRLIDQLEAAGIVGSFEGSKARQVLIGDLVTLQQLLENEKK